MNIAHIRDGSFLYKVSLLLAAIGILLSNLGSVTHISRAQDQDLIPLELTLSVAPDPTRDIDGATVNVLVEAGGAPVEGVEVLLQSNEIGDYAGFEDGDPSTLLASSVTVTTDSYGRATTSWGLVVCLFDPLSLTITAEAHKDGYLDASVSKTIIVVPHIEMNLPPHGTETIYYDVSTHKTFVSIRPSSEGNIKVGDTINLEIEVGREINYTNLDLWNVPVIKGRGAVLLSIPKVNGVPVAHVVDDDIVTEVYLYPFSDDWVPISQIEEFARLVQVVEWLVRIEAIAGLSVIKVALGEVPGLVSFLGELLYGVGQGAPRV